MGSCCMYTALFRVLMAVVPNKGDRPSEENLLRALDWNALSIVLDVAPRYIASVPATEVFITIINSLFVSGAAKPLAQVWTFMFLMRC